MRRRPPWLEWEVVLSLHAEKRMLQRDFTEIDIRTMLMSISSLRPDVLPGRWLARASWKRRRWDIVLEPDQARSLLVVVTAFPITR